MTADGNSAAQPGLDVEAQRPEDEGPAPEPMPASEGREAPGLVHRHGASAPAASASQAELVAHNGPTSSSSDKVAGSEAPSEEPVVMPATHLEIAKCEWCEGWRGGGWRRRRRRGGPHSVRGGLGGVRTMCPHVAGSRQLIA